MAIPTLAALATQGITLRGVVISDEMLGPPLPNAMVLLEGGSEVVTDDSGRFAIPVPQGKSGIPLRLEARLPGYLPVCPAHLDVTLADDENDPQLSILLVREPLWEAMAQRFYAQACAQALSRRPTSANQSPNVDSDTPVETSILSSRDRDLVLRAKESWGRLFSKVPIEAMSPRYRLALKCFLDGELQNALDVLDHPPIESPPESSAGDGSQQLESRLLQARILVIQLRFAQARSLHQSTVATAPESFPAWFAMALFEQALHKHEEARKAFHRALELARQSKRSDRIADTLEGLGHLHREQARFEDARRTWQEALVLRRNLALESPERYLPRVAATLNDLATLYLELGNPTPARTAFNEALEIYRKLSASFPRVFAPLVASIQSNLGALSSAEGRVDDGRRNLEEAIRIQRELVARSPAEHRLGLARSLFNLALHEHRQKCHAPAEAAYSDSLVHYRILAEDQPTTFTADVADNLNNLGILYREWNRRPEAVQSLKAALAAYREAAKEHPDRFRRSIERLEVRIRELASPLSASTR